MKFDLVKPCKNCPFRNDETRITFYNRDRAEEIAETAYRRGFPCHVTAEHVEEDKDPIGGGGFYPIGDSQMCGGFIAMKLNEQDVPPSFQLNDDELDEEDLFAKLEIQYGEFWNLPVYESEEDFLKANENEQDKKEKSR